eukprot:6180824-Pleurochrysis_carterae.AAC.3
MSCIISKKLLSSEPPRSSHSHCKAQGKYFSLHATAYSRRVPHARSHFVSAKRCDTPSGRHRLCTRRKRRQFGFYCTKNCATRRGMLCRRVQMRSHRERHPQPPNGAGARCRGQCRSSALAVRAQHAVVVVESGARLRVCVKVSVAHPDVSARRQSLRMPRRCRASPLRRSGSQR